MCQIFPMASYAFISTTFSNKPSAVEKSFASYFSNAALLNAIAQRTNSLEDFFAYELPSVSVSVLNAFAAASKRLISLLASYKE